MLYRTIWSLDYWFTRRLFIDYVFLANGMKMEKNLKALLMQVTKSLGDAAVREIASSINESLDRS